MDKSAVPKFGSFKPKSTAKSTILEEGQLRSQSRKPDNRERRRSRERDHDHRRRHRDDLGEYSSRHGSDRRERSHERRRKTPDPVPKPTIATDEFEESDLFIIDRCGDTKNVEYGSLHRYSIPSYRRSGYGKVLGQPLPVKIDREESNDKEIRFTSNRKSERESSKLLSSRYGKGSQSKLRLVKSISESTDPIDVDYIQIRTSRKRKRGSESPVDDSTTVDYRSIEGKAKAFDRQLDSDLEDASDSGGEDLDDSLQTRKENGALSKKARANPTDLDSWLMLVQHQAKILGRGVYAQHFTSPERRTLADLRLSILNEASSHIVRGHPNRARLLRAIILEGSFIWDSAKTSSKWKEALTECPSSTLLWTDYLGYIQDTHSDFRYDTCKDTYIQCLEMLRDERLRRNSKDGGSIALVQVYVLLRLTFFIREAGYEELAISIWQAVFEWNFQMPEHLMQSPLGERLDAFEEFWESETPRIGEQGSKGWTSFYASRDEVPRDVPQQTISLGQPGQRLAIFASQETTLSGFVLPASTEDDDATSDPFRCVLFSDLKVILEPLSDDLPRRLLVSALLHFLGLPQLASTDVQYPVLTWQQDPHLVGVWGHKPRLHPFSSCWEGSKSRCRLETTDSLFSDSFTVFSEHTPTFQDDTLDKFANRALDALVSREPRNEELAEYSIAFKQKLFPEEVIKATKTLLKRNQNSLRLYNAYALVEANRDNMSKAEGVWSTALGAKITSSAHDEILLWHSRMVAQLLANNNKGAFDGLLSLVDGVGQEHRSFDGEGGLQVRRLKVRRLLEERIDATMLSRKPSHAPLAIDCLASLEYLANDCDISAALQVFRTHEPRIVKSNLPMATELLQQQKARLFEMHMQRRRPFKPAVLMKELEDALQMFPSNSMLLDAHGKMASQDRLRTLVQKEKTSTTATMTIVEWSHKVAAEVLRVANNSFGSTPNAIRSVFQKALMSHDSLVRHAPALWFRWLEFEYSLGKSTFKDDALRRTKEVFLDGLRHIPWVKGWAIEGIRMLSHGGMGHGELRQAYEVLVERGLRIRVDLESLG